MTDEQLFDKLDYAQRVNAMQRKRIKELEAEIERLRELSKNALFFLAGTRAFMLEKHGTTNRARNETIAALEKELGVQVVTLTTEIQDG